MMYVCMYACMHVCMYECMHASSACYCLFVSLSAYSYTCIHPFIIYIYIYIFKYINDVIYVNDASYRYDVFFIRFETVMTREWCYVFCIFLHLSRNEPK